MAGFGSLSQEYPADLFSTVLNWSPPQPEPTGMIPGSLLDRLMRKKTAAEEFMPPLPAKALEKFGPQAGMLTPGVGGLDGNLPVSMDAPLGPLDPNYAKPNATPSPFLSPVERQMQSLVDPNAANSPRVPMPKERPAEADAVPEAAPETATDLSSRGVTPGAPVNLVPPQLSAPATDQNLTTAPAPQSIWDKIQSGLSDRSSQVLAIGAGFAGAPNIGQGISRAAAAAIPAKAADEKRVLTQASQRSTYEALIKAGVPRDQAIAGLTNPDIMKSLVTNYLGDRKGEIVDGPTDKYGNKSRLLFNPFTQKLSNLDGTPYSAASAGGVNSLANSDSTGKDYLDELKKADPKYALQVESIINGDTPFPTGRQSQTPFGRKLIEDVLTSEPGTTASDFTNRKGVKEDYSKGMSSRITKSLNTTVQHGAGLEKAIGDLHNFSLMPGFLNPATGFVQKQYSEKYQNARKAFDANAEPYVKELDFVLSGGRPTVTGSNELRKLFDIDAAPNENMSALRKTMDMLKGRLDSHTEGYNKGMRTQREGIDFIDPVNKVNFKHLMGDTGAASAAPAEMKPYDITQGLISGKLKASDYPTQARLLEDAKRRGLIP